MQIHKSKNVYHCGNYSQSRYTFEKSTKMTESKMKHNIQTSSTESTNLSIRDPLNWYFVWKHKYSSKELTDDKTESNEYCECSVCGDKTMTPCLVIKNVFDKDVIKFIIDYDKYINLEPVCLKCATYFCPFRTEL